MTVEILFVILFFCIFAFVQTIVMIKNHTTPYAEARKRVEQIRDSKSVLDFVNKKQIWLKRYGADIFLSDGITVSQWYLYKSIVAAVVFGISMLIGKGVVKSDATLIVSVLLTIGGWLFLDLYVRMQNKSSNDAMMADICEMSRSVLYGKRGGQYIAEALSQAVTVVENKRLKTALIRMHKDLEANRSIEDCLDDLELSFSNGEISAFCTVIKSLQFTGQVDEALNTLESNIEREQVSVNKKRCVILENKTMAYVMMIAFDILAVILYCIVMKLLEMQIAF